MATGSTYALTLGTASQEIALTQVATTYGVSGGMGDMGGRGGMNGGPGGFAPTSATAGSATGDTALPGGSGTPPTKPDGDSDPRPSGEAHTRPDGEDGTTDRPTPPDGSADGRPVTPRDGQTTPDQQAETGESFPLDKNGKVLLLASAAVLALGLTVAFLYRKKG